MSRDEIAERPLPVEAKGIDAICLDNYVRLIFTSNEDWVIPAGELNVIAGDRVTPS